jgi:hypothetical protein
MRTPSTSGSPSNSLSGTRSAKVIRTSRTARARSAATVSMAIKRLSRMIATRSATRSTSLMMCEDINTVCPAVRASSTNCRNVCWTSGSSPEVGSSRISSSGWCMNACTSPTFCRLPFDRLRIRAGSSSCSRSASATIPARGTPPRRFARKVRHSSAVCRVSTTKSPARYDGWARLMSTQNAVVRQMTDAAERGIAAAGEHSRAASRLADMRDFYTYLMRELPAVIDRWRADKTVT